MNKRIEDAQRRIDDLALRSECTRLAIRHAERSGRRDVDPARVDSLLTLFGTELEHQRKG